MVGLKKINYFFFCLLLTIILSCNQVEKKSIAVVHKDGIKMGEYTTVIIPAPDSTFGYDIYKGDELIIHQPTHPIIMQPIGLFTQEDAEKMAAYVIEKVKFTGKLPQQYPDSLIGELEISTIRPKH